MGKYLRDELSDALQVVSSVISKCETGKGNMPWKRLNTSAFRRLLTR